MISFNLSTTSAFCAFLFFLLSLKRLIPPATAVTGLAKETIANPIAPAEILATGALSQIDSSSSVKAGSLVSSTSISAIAGLALSNKPIFQAENAVPS